MKTKSVAAVAAVIAPLMTGEVLACSWLGLDGAPDTGIDGLQTTTILGAKGYHVDNDDPLQEGGLSTRFYTSFGQPLGDQFFYQLNGIVGGTNGDANKTYAGGSAHLGVSDDQNGELSVGIGSLNFRGDGLNDRYDARWVSLTPTCWHDRFRFRATGGLSWWDEAGIDVDVTFAGLQATYFADDNFAVGGQVEWSEQDIGDFLTVERTTVGGYLSFKGGHGVMTKSLFINFNDVDYSSPLGFGVQPDRDEIVVGGKIQIYQLYPDQRMAIHPSLIQHAKNGIDENAAAQFGAWFFF